MSRERPGSDNLLWNPRSSLLRPPSRADSLRSWRAAASVRSGGNRLRNYRWPWIDRSGGDVTQPKSSVSLNAVYPTEFYHWPDSGCVQHALLQPENANKIL